MSEFKKIRKELGLTQAEFAKELGMLQPAVSRREKGLAAVSKRDLMAAKYLALKLSNDQAA